MRPKCHLTNFAPGRGASFDEADSPTRRARPLSQLRTRHACLWTGLVALAAMALVAQPVRAAVTEAWVQRYSNVVTNSRDEAVKAACDAAGDIIVTGTTEDGINTDMMTVKYSGANGSVLWQKRYNGPNAIPTALAVDSSGNVVVTGYSGNRTNNYHDYYTAKYAAADGALLWEQRYNRYSYKGDPAVAVDGSGNVVVTGGTGQSLDCDCGPVESYTAKYAAADGALLWERRDIFGVSHAAVAVDASGNVVVIGSSNNGTNWGYYTAKYAAANGALLWEKRGPGGGGAALAVDGSGNVVVTGSHDDYYTAKYAAADGALLWEKRGPGGGGAALAADGSGNVVVTGFSWNGSTYDYYTVKYAAADGALLWEKRGPGGFAYAVAVDSSGNVAVTGTSYNGATDHDFDYYTAKYAAADGALLWERRYNGPANSNDWASAVAVDGSGNVVVTGTSYNGTNADYYTAKYAAADGALLWEKRYNGPGNGDDAASSLALGPNGMVAVTGSSSGDYATVVYREVQAQFNYTTENGTITLTGYTGPGGAVAIPDTINGMPVTRIGDLAFYNYTRLTSVTIPNSVTNIGDYAFAGCTNLTSVTIPNSVTSIAGLAFWNCSSLTEVYFQGNAPSVGYGAFLDADNATVYHLPGTTGWGTTFGDRPTALWVLSYPLILNNGPSFGVQAGFSFVISWATNISVVVEASTSLANPAWVPVGTNILTDGASYFSDPQWTNHPARFYRLRSP